MNDRSWDLIFSTKTERSTVQPAEIAQFLRNAGREIPIIQLEQQPTETDQEHAIQQGIDYLLSRKSEQIILARALKLFEQQKMIRRLHQLELGIEQLSKLNHQLIEDSSLAIVYLEDRHLTDANSAFRSLFNLDKEALRDLSLNRIFTAKSLQQIEATLKTGSSSATEILMLKDDHGAEFGAQVEIFAPTPDKPTMRQMHIDHLALTSKNTKTGTEAQQILTKTEFIAKLETSVQSALMGGHDAFLLYFEFKPLPLTTDKNLLQQLRHALSHRLRELTSEHSLAMLEGLSLAVLIETPDREVAKACAQQVQSLTNSTEFRLPGGISSLGFSIGITAINDSAPAPNELLQRVTQTLRPLTEQFSPQSAFINPLQHQIEIDDATRELEQAIAEHKLRLFYQPLVALDEANIEKNFEILVRMRDGESQTRLPSQFLATLAQSRVMVQMDRWVAETILHELKGRQGKITNTQVFINLARRTLRSSSFTPWLAGLLEELGVDGKLVVFELSESDTASDLKASAHFCSAVRTMGIKICLKHFGCSPSSVKIYKSLHPEYIKIDGSYIEEINTPDKGAGALKRLLLPLDRNHTRVIAPLIEDAGTLSELYRMGIDLVQGYYLQPPQEEMSYEYFENRD